MMPTPKPSLSTPTAQRSTTSPPVLPTPSSSTSLSTHSTLKQQLERQLAKHEKRLEETVSGIEKNVLTRQISQLKERLRELDRRQQHDLAPGTLEKLRNLERDLNNYRSPRAPMPTQSSSTLQDSLLPLPPPPSGSTPTKRRSKVPNADRRNTDIEFATEIGQGLLLEVRKMQALLQEKEELLSQLEIQKSDLERAAEAMAKQLRQKEENEERLKEETWNLELAKQELTMSVTELQQNLNRMTTEQTRLMKHMNDLSTEIERMRDKEEKLNQTIEDMKTRHEHDMSLIRRHAAGLQREKVDQAKQIETLTSELAIAKAQTRINKRSLSDLQVATKADKTDTASPDSSDKEHTSPKTSPPSSPRQTSGGNQMLEVETLKTSLAHAHRMVSNLRSTLHREKTEKFELKKLLAESQETIEQMQNDPRMWVDAGGRAAAEGTPRRPQHKKKRRTTARKSRALGGRRQQGGDNNEEWIEEQEISDSQASTDAEEEELNENAPGLATLSSELSKSQQNLQTLGDQLMQADEKQNAPLSLGDQLAQATEREQLSSSSKASLGDELAQANAKQIPSPAIATTSYQIGQGVQTSMPPVERTDAATQTDEAMSLPVEMSIQTAYMPPSLQTVRIPSMSATPTKRNPLHETTLECVSAMPVKRNTLHDVTLESVGISPTKRNTLHDTTLESVDISPTKRNTLHDTTLESVDISPTKRNTLHDTALEPVVVSPVKRNTLRDATLESVNVTPTERGPLQDATLISASSIGQFQAVGSTEHMSPVPSNAASMTYEDMKRYSLKTNDSWAETTLKAVQHGGYVGLNNTVDQSILEQQHQAPHTTEMLPAHHVHNQDIPSQKDASCNITPVPSSTEEFNQHTAGNLQASNFATSTNVPVDIARSSPILIDSSEPREHVQSPNVSMGTVVSKMPALTSDNNAHTAVSASLAEVSHGVSIESSAQTDTATTGMLAPDVSSEDEADTASTAHIQAKLSGSTHTPVSADNTLSSTFVTENVQSMFSTQSKDHDASLIDAPATTTLGSDLLTRAQAEAMVEAAVAQYRKRLAELEQQNGTVAVYPPSSPELPPPRPTSPAPSSLLNKALSTRSRALSVSSSSENRFGTALISSQSTTYISRRFNERRGSDSISSSASTIERRPSLTSSQIDAAARTANSLTDPNAIALITQTMIGDWMWKYTRKAVGNGLSERRHRRFFWIHPYTRTLYWSPQAPGADGKEAKAKSAYIENITTIPDHSQQPAGLPNVSLLIQTSNRQLKITAPDMSRHEVWHEALSYLIARANGSERRERDISDSLSTAPPSSIFRKPSFQHLQSSLHSGGSSIVEEDDDDDEALEDVRMCCNGKHHVSKLEKHNTQRKTPA